MFLSYLELEIPLKIGFCLTLTDLVSTWILRSTHGADIEIKIGVLPVIYHKMGENKFYLRTKKPKVIFQLFLIPLLLHICEGNTKIAPIYFISKEE